MFSNDQSKRKRKKNDLTHKKRIVHLDNNKHEKREKLWRVIVVKNKSETREMDFNALLW